MTPARTSETRSGDRVRNGMIIAGFSSTGVAIILDPYITAWMAHQTSAYGIHFKDPEGWKTAVVQVAIVVFTAVWGFLHMWLIRKADRMLEGVQLLPADWPPAPPRPPAALDPGANVRT